MERWLPLALFGFCFGALMIGLSRYQAARYNRYLMRHGDETARIAEGQNKIIAQQERSILISERNAAAIERIATALENRKS